MSVDTAPATRALEALIEAQAIAAPHPRLLSLRNAGEALAEALRSGPSVSIAVEHGERLALEREVALPALRLPLAFLTVARRGWRIALPDGDLVIDPPTPGSFVRTPFGERFGQRHPLRQRALASERAAPREASRIVLTTLRYQSLALLLEQHPSARIEVHPREHARYLDPSPQERAAYERNPVVAHPRLVLSGPRMLAPGVVLIDTPGVGDSVSVAANERGTIRVISPHGVALDCWTPYESKLPGLRETLRLRDIEAVTRGDADPVESAVSMGLERSLADRRRDHPAYFAITPSLELCASAIAPLSPTVPSHS